MNTVLNTLVNWPEGSPLRKSFEWVTDLVSYDNRKEQRNQLLEQPIRHWFLNFPMLPEANRNSLIELFNRARGRNTTFLYTDTDDYACTYTQCSITAVAAQVDFQLKKRYYVSESEYWDEDKKDIVSGAIYAPTVKVDAVTKTEGVDYTLDDTTGIVTFGAAPGAGTVITADYQFYFRVRFNADTYMDVMPAATYFALTDMELVEVLS